MSEQVVLNELAVQLQFLKSNTAIASHPQEELELLRSFGFTEKVESILQDHQALELMEKGYLMIRQPAWRRESTLGLPYYSYEITNESIHKSLLGIKKIVSKGWRYLVNIPLDVFVGEVPLELLDKIKNNTRETPPNYYRIWSSVTGKQYDVLNDQAKITLRRLDPVLVGYWLDVDPANVIRYPSTYGRIPLQRKYCAVMGMWGEDLEEINLAFLEASP